MKKNPPVRVAFFYNNKDIGGPDINLADYARYIDRSCIEPVFVLSQRRREIEPYLQFYKDRSIEVLFHPVLRLNRRDRPLSNNLRFLYSLPRDIAVFRRILRNCRIQVVVAMSNTEVQAMLAARLLRVPLIVMTREILTGAATWPLRQLVLFLASRITVASQAVGQAMFRRHLHKPTKIVLLHDGIDADRVESPELARKKIRSEFGLREDVIVVVTVANLDPWKGHHVLLKAAVDVCRKFRAVRLIIVGGDSQHALKIGYREQLERIAEAGGIRERVILTGYRHDAREIMLASDIYVQASVLPDPFPNSVLEAMASGKPVIGSRLGGIPEQVVEGETGLLFAPGDEHELTQAICYLVRLPELRDQMGRAGRDRVKNQFTCQKAIKEVSELCLSLVPATRQADS